MCVLRNAQNTDNSASSYQMKFPYMLIRKNGGNHQSKRRKYGGKPQWSKPEKQGGMPQHRHCPLGKHREDKNPKYHE
jgi:hypothetical protein